jgi:Gef2-related medial cortical node protein Nod1
MVDGSKDKSRPHSPVKLLANIFGGSLRESPIRRPHQTTLSLIDIPQLQPNLFRRKSDEIPVQSEEVNVTNTALAALERLEETLSSYLLALHSRKGNIVGKVLRSRAVADELAINELYNSMLEDPSNYQHAAQVSVDVLFSAFEKYVKIAWQDKMGQIISTAMWEAIQAKLDSFQPGEFEDTFRLKFNDMSPQNQRALRAIVKLLVDLLEGTGNDGDRGILTASFADVLVPEGPSQHFVSLLDRLVEDIDPLLTQKPYADHGMNTSPDRSANNGSITSNTSSLRKKFGLLTRRGSKTQTNDTNGEPEGISVWRTLSKSKHGNGSPSSSLSKASSMVTLAALSPKRPVSRDRPTILGAFAFENSRPLTTIGEGQAVIGPPRKKRRSSLSDLMSLQNSASNTPTFMSPRTPNKGESSPRGNESPRTPSPVKHSMIPQPSPVNQNGYIRATSPTRRENSPVRTLPRGMSPPKLKPTPSTPTSDEVTITSHHNTSSRRRNTGTGSSIPTLKQNPTTGGLSERPTSGNIRKLPPPPVSNDKPASVEKIAPLNPAAGKLRMQSPQKIRERLAAEQKALASTEAALQSDLNKVTDEITSAGRSRTSHHSRTQSNSIIFSPADLSASTSSVSSSPARTVESKLATVATKHAALLTALKSRIDALSADLQSSLVVSEQRAKNLDDLYREASAENEALYVRFNDELARMLDAVRAGDGEKEMRRRVKEAEEESLKLRRENGRLKREVVGLRAQLKE